MTTGRINQVSRLWVCTLVRRNCFGSREPPQPLGYGRNTHNAASFQSPHEEEISTATVVVQQAALGPPVNTRLSAVRLAVNSGHWHGSSSHGHRSPPRHNIDSAEGRYRPATLCKNAGNYPRCWNCVEHRSAGAAQHTTQPPPPLRGKEKNFNFCWTHCAAAAAETKLLRSQKEHCYAAAATESSAHTEQHSHHTSNAAAPSFFPLLCPSPPNTVEKFYFFLLTLYLGALSGRSFFS